MWPSRRDGYEVLIHGIDPGSVRPGPLVRDRLRSDLGVADDEVLSLTVANLRRNKDYPTLLRAARVALDAEPGLRFAAVGQGPLAQEVAALHTTLGLGDRFLLLGFRRDVHDLMAAADVFTLASAHEGLPVAVMEAFAHGLPVVATAVGGLPSRSRTASRACSCPPAGPRRWPTRCSPSPGTPGCGPGWAPRRSLARTTTSGARCGSRSGCTPSWPDTRRADPPVTRADRRPCRT